MILWLVMIPLIAAVFMAFLGRWRLIAAPLSAAALAATGLLAVATGQDEMIVLGRSLSISLSKGLTMGLALLSLSVVMLFTSRTAHRPQVYSLALAAIAVFVAGAMVRNMMIAALLLASGSVLAVMVIPTDEAGSAKAAMRAMIQMALAMLLLIGSAWALEQARVTPDAVDLARFGAISLALACGIILAVAPFHLWLQNRGWEEPKIVMRAWLAGIMLAIFGLWLGLI